MARKSEGLTKDEQELWQNLNATVYMMRKRGTPIRDELLLEVEDWQKQHEKLIEDKLNIIRRIK